MMDIGRDDGVKTLLCAVPNEARGKVFFLSDFCRKK